MTQTTTAPETTPAVRRGFPLPCLKCGESAALTLRLDAMGEDDALHCPECDADYSLADVRGRRRGVVALLAWCDPAAQLPAEG